MSTKGIVSRLKRGVPQPRKQSFPYAYALLSCIRLTARVVKCALDSESLATVFMITFERYAENRKQVVVHMFVVR